MIGMVLTGNDLLRTFRERLDSSARVDIATAWATEGDALTALLESTERDREPVQVRVIVGLHGYTTTPDALKKLRRLGDLRVVPGEPLFHAKVYIFWARNGNRLAWVGSANLTGKGFGSNEEVMFQTRSAKPLVAWFEREWTKVGRLDERLLQQYIDGHRHPEGAHDERLKQRGLPRVRRLVFHSNGKGKEGYEGVCRVLTPRGQPNGQFHYSTHVEAVEQVVGRLTRGRRGSDVLKLIERDGLKVSGKPLVSSREKKVHRKPSAKDRGQKPRRFGRWWISHDTSSQQKLNFIVSVAEICDACVELDEDSRHGF